VLPGLNLWFWLHGERPGEAGHLPLMVGMWIAISLYAWWAANASERGIIEGSRSSAPSAENARRGLVAYVGSANLIAIGGFSATQIAGWAWGGAFYATFVLLAAGALVRCRRRAHGQRRSQ